MTEKPPEDAPGWPLAWALIGIVIFSASAAQQALSAPTDFSNYFFSGNTLLSLCKSDRSVIIAYIQGIHDAFEWEGSLNFKKYCSPPTAKVGQFVDIVCQFLDKYPQVRHYSAAFNVQQALIQAWPCK